MAFIVAAPFRIPTLPFFLTRGSLADIPPLGGSGHCSGDLVVTLPWGRGLLDSQHEGPGLLRVQIPKDFFFAIRHLGCLLQFQTENIKMRRSLRN